MKKLMVLVLETVISIMVIFAIDHCISFTEEWMAYVGFMVAIAIGNYFGDMIRKRGN